MLAQNASNLIPVRRIHTAVLVVIGCGLGLTILQRALLIAISDGRSRAPVFLRFDVPLWLLWLPLSPIIVIAARQWSFQKRQATDLAAHLGVATLLAVIHTVAFSAMQIWMLDGAGRQPIMMMAAGLLSWRLAVDVFVYATILAITLAIDAAQRLRSAEPPSSPVTTRWHRNPNRPIAVVDGTRTLLFEPHEVSLIEAADYYAKVHARGRTWLVRESLDSLEARLASPPFFRAHRSAIVNVRFVTGLQKLSRHRHEAVLRDGVRVAVSAERRTRLEDLLVGVRD